MMIKFGAEHHVPQLSYVYLAKQIASRVKYRQYVAAAQTDLMHNLSQFHIGRHSCVIIIHYAVESHQSEHRIVRMVSDELALPSQSHAIDAVRFEYAYREI